MWHDNIPPVPDGAWLERVAFVEDDVPAEPVEDEAVIDFMLESSELTEHHRDMLASPEERIKQPVFPSRSAIQ